MTRPAPPPPHPSWRLPIAVGAAATLVLHSPALFDHLLWVMVIGACGCSGVPSGALATMLALRKEPDMGVVNGFTVAFTAGGVGMLVAAVYPALAGLQVSDEEYDWLQGVLIQGGESAQKAAETVGQFQDHGAASVVLASGLVAMCSGFTGAAVAAWKARRSRASSPAPPPPAPPSA